MNEWYLFSLILISIFSVLLATNWLQAKTLINSDSIRIFVHILVGLTVSIIL